MTFTNKIIKKIENKGKGWVFCPKDFSEIRHTNTINPLIDRIEKRGKIRSLGKGLYEYPRIDCYGNYIKPDLHAIIRALEKQLNTKLQFDGKFALSYFKIDEHPNKNIYLSNHKSYKINISNYEIVVKKTLIPTPQNKYDKATLAVQAIKSLGKSSANKYSAMIVEQLTSTELKKAARISKVIEWVHREFKKYI